MNSQPAYIKQVISNMSFVILLISIVGVLLDLMLWHDKHPVWVIYFNFPVLIVSLPFFFLSVFKRVPANTSFLIYIYAFTICFYLPGFIDPADSRSETLEYFAKIGTCITYILLAGSMAEGKHVINLGIINSVLYILLSWFFYYKQGSFYIDHVNLFSFVGISIVVYITFQHINAAIAENEQNKQQLQKAEKEILRMRLDEENKRTHYLSVMQQTNTQFVNELNRKIDLIMDLKNDDERRAEMRSLNQLCQQYHYDTEKTETAQWQKNTDAEFIAALQNICPALTPKEQHICSLIRIRLQTKEIAVKLNASTETIKWHRKHIRKKLDIEDNESLTVFLSKIADRA